MKTGRMGQFIAIDWHRCNHMNDRCRSTDVETIPCHCVFIAERIQTIDIGRSIIDGEGGYDSVVPSCCVDT